MSAPHEAEDLTLPFTCPECGGTGTKERYAQVDYSCPECHLTVAHVDLAPTGVVREVFGWLLTPGQVLLDRYKVVNLLGRGGFAATYGVEDTRLANRRCALKEVPKLMFDRGEMEILSRLDHPGIPNIRDTFEQGEMVYLVLEFGGSRSLAAERLERGGRIDSGTLLPWIRQLCEVLEYLHSQNPPIVHRDLKPGNVLVNEDGRISLIDFGIAKESDGGTQTRTIARSASHGFSPPEQVMGTGTDQRSDVYALGATLYQLLTGQKPVPAHERVAGTEMPSPRSLVPDTPEALESLIVRSMELNINRRVQSISEFAAEIGAVVSGRPAATPAPAARNIDDAPTLGGPGRMPESLARGETMVLAPGTLPGESNKSGFPVWLGGLIAVGVVGAASAAWWMQREPISAPAGGTATAEVVEPDATTAIATPRPEIDAKAPNDPVAAATPETGSGSDPASTSTLATSASGQVPAVTPEAAVAGAQESVPEPPVAEPVRVAPKPPRQTVAKPVGTDRPPPVRAATDPTRRERIEPPVDPPVAKPEPNWGGGFRKGNTRRLD